MGASILIPTPPKIWKNLTGKILQNSLFHSETYFFDIRSFLILKNAAEWYRNYLIPSVERPEQKRNTIFFDFSLIMLFPEARILAMVLPAPIPWSKKPSHGVLPSYGPSIPPKHSPQKCISTISNHAPDHHSNFFTTKIVWPLLTNPITQKLPWSIPFQTDTK